MQLRARSQTYSSQLSASVAARPVTWLLAALGCLLMIRIAALAANRTDLFFDEAQYWFWSLEPAFGYYSKPPLIAWIIALSTGVCGASEFCIRLPAPVLHTATALAVFALGARLYDVRTGALAALAFALLPGVSVSAGLISTDVPLLLCWALSLIGFAALFQTAAWWPALLLGAAFGAGLNAKYAMAWFVLCAGLYLAATPARRTILRDARLWVGLSLGFALIVPNLAWNQAHSFATFAHTADNAKWEGGSFVNPLKALEFFGSQFGVFGPLYFAGLLIIAWRSRTTAPPEPDRLLLAFSLPLVAIITVQAFLSRAHPNWAAPAYIAGVVLVIATLTRDLSWGWLKASYAIHAALFGLLIAATSLAGTGRLPLPTDPMARLLGWSALAAETRAELAAARARGEPYGAVLTDDRAISAELLYYMRNEPTPVLAWRAGPRPHDHFELTRPFAVGTREPVLLVSLKSGAGDLVSDLGVKATRNGVRSVTQGFARAAVIAERTIAAGPTSSRRVTFLALSGYKSP
jgi:4-amino-4-deoxy-L-arabinose transferase-like glycosyltransferase